MHALLPRSAAIAAPLALAALLSGCASAPPVQTRWQAPPVGATWETAQRNTGSFGPDAQMRMTRENGTWQGRDVAVLRNSRGGAIMADPVTGRWYAVVAPDGKPVLSYEPAIGFQYPVQIGASSTVHYKLTNHAANRTVEFDYSCKVEAFEKVTVRAGTFDAYRVACKAPGSEEVYWSSPDLGVFVKSRLVRSATAPQGPGTQETELVSAPRR